MEEILIAIAVGLVMLLGLAGVLLPVFPDLVLIWGAALGYGLVLGWGEAGLWIFGIMTVLGLVGMLAEIWVSSASARRRGASWEAIAVGLGLGAIGFFLLTPLGGLTLLLLGTLLVEYYRQKDLEKALRSMLGIGLGYGVSVGVKIGVALTMIGLWLVWVFLP
jgi:hypothetical protein